jgi:hypothetical protein
MGVIVEFFGIEAGFYIMGVLLFAICIYLAITVAKYRIDEI